MKTLFSRKKQLKLIRRRMRERSDLGPAEILKATPVRLKVRDAIELGLNTDGTVKKTMYQVTGTLVQNPEGVRGLYRSVKRATTQRNNWNTGADKIVALLKPVNLNTRLHQAASQVVAVGR